MTWGEKERLVWKMFGFILGVIFLTSPEVFASSEPVSHQLVIALNPSRHWLSGTDKVVLPRESRTFLRFRLNSRLSVKKLLIEGVDVTKKMEKVNSEKIYVEYQAPLPAKALKENLLALEVIYEGEIYDPVKTDKELAFVIGDRTTGLIGEEGIFLTGETVWYPQFGDLLGIYQLRASIPTPWVIVSQGQEVKQSRSGKNREFIFSSDIPADSLTLVGGKYKVHSRMAGSVVVSTYFFEEEEALSDLFLNKTAEYLEKFSGILTPYPYKKFDIVENFFTTGYGFPSFTLLGKGVIQMGERALRPGYIDHEIVHCWFGNYVYFPPGEGNWVEGLTTYIANYYTQELESPEKAREYRKGVSLKYSLRVPGEKDYPVRKFEGKEEDYENDIGYGKVSMIFHLLREMTGEEEFFFTLREFIRRYGGKYATWEDIKKVFEESLRGEIPWFFHQWLDRAGLPQLQLQDVQLEKKVSDRGSPLPHKEYLVQGKIVQVGEPYILPVTLRIQFSREYQDFSLWVDKAEVPFQYSVKSRPVRVELDPDFLMPRKIPRDEIPSSLNFTLESKPLKIVLPGKVSEKAKALYRTVAERARQFKGGEILQDSEISEEEAGESSFLVLGSPSENAFLQKILQKYADERVKLEEQGFQIQGKSYSNPGDSVLVSFRNPSGSQRSITVYYGLSDEAIEKARLIFYYGWESWVVFHNGTPVERGTWEVPSPATQFSFSFQPSQEISEENIEKMLNSLTAPELNGRMAGSPGAEAVASLLGNFLTESQSFQITVKDLASDSLFRIGREKGLRTLPFYPFYFSPETGESPLSFNRVFYAGYGTDPESYTQDAEGALVLMEDGLPPGSVPSTEEPLKALLDKIKRAQEQGARGVLLLLPDKSYTFPPSAISFPSHLSPPDENKRREEERAGEGKDLRLKVVGAHSRLPVPDFPLQIPVFAVEKKWILPVLPTLTRGILKNRAAELKIHYTFESLPCKNLLAILPGSDPEKKNEYIVIGAHYDHLGVNNRKEPYPGAVDNASGVTALLELYRLLEENPEKPKRTLVFVAFDGEEWGLQGSSYFTENFPNLSQVVLMLNIDSIAGTTEKGIYLIGQSFFPNIASIIQEKASQMGFEIKEDIDRYAYRFGSDFYPFYLKGIPAVGFFDANYRSIHKITDTIAQVSLEKLKQLILLFYEVINDFANDTSKI